MLDDSDTVVISAREVVLAGHTGDLDAIERAATSDDPVLRARAVSAAAKVGTRSVPDRVRALRDPSNEVRRRACELEARTPRPSSRVAKALIACLGDDDPLVVVSAAEALGELRSRDVVAPLGELVSSHDDARCREAAIAALGALGFEEGLDAVLAGLSDKPAVRRRAVVALAAFSGQRVEDAISAALDDKDWQVRQAAEALVAAGEAGST